MTGDDGSLPPTTENASSQRGIEILGQPADSRIKRVVAVMSGKGGVGKSSVAALLAVGLAKNGHAVGILDGDITGPSIPKLFGLGRDVATLDERLIPHSTRLGIRVMSLNLLLESEDQPVIWRGPLLAGAVKQFWTDVIWGDLDYLVVDLPPGTGDVTLTVLQSLPVDGVIVVSTPQQLSQLIVKKSVNMVNMMKVPLLGIVENMAWVSCPHCGERFEPFGHLDTALLESTMGLPILGTLPVDPAV